MTPTHTKGPFTVVGPSTGKQRGFDDGGDYAVLDQMGLVVAEAFRKVDRAEERPAFFNASLLARFDEVPHDCADATCPGAVNKRKLEAFEGLRLQLWAAHDLLTALLSFYKKGHDDIKILEAHISQYRFALDKAEDEPMRTARTIEDYQQGIYKALRAQRGETCT